MNNINIIAPALFLGALISTYYIVPKIKDVVLYKKLMDNPNERSSHEKPTPSLGGVAFFMVLMISFYFSSSFDKYNDLISILPGLTILFLIGMKDDLVVLAPITKLGAQVLSAFFVVFNYKLNIGSLHGFMGIEGMPAWVGAILSVVIIVAAINSLNLIDGIDGLASTIGIIIFTGFGIIFYLMGKEFWMLTSLVMIGNLIAFLRYNLSKKYKIFMGDTGSMLIGFLVGVMAVRVLSVDISVLAKLPLNIENLPYVVLALLIVPMFDTSRVFTVRLWNKHSPFYPDRNHIHHLIIDFFGISHRRACFYIGLVNFLFVTGISILAMFTNQWTLLLIFILIIVAAVLFFYSIRRPRQAHRMVNNKMTTRNVHSS